MLSHKDSSPGVTSGKTQASTGYTKTSSDLSGNNVYSYGKTTASNASHQRCSSIGKQAAPYSLAKAKTTIANFRTKTLKARSSQNLNCYSQQRGAAESE